MKTPLDTSITEQPAIDALVRLGEARREVGEELMLLGETKAVMAETLAKLDELDALRERVTA